MSALSFQSYLCPPCAPIYFQCSSHLSSAHKYFFSNSIRKTDMHGKIKHNLHTNCPLFPTPLKYFYQMCLAEGPNTVDAAHMVTAGINLKISIQWKLPSCFIFLQQQNGNIDDICLSSCSLCSKHHSSLRS